uniref:Uncharacterized protein n=1 Tax=Chromera velia CCMP2878 TaxID=1169474 RepID=A0A0G4HNC4_9ALVE|eukprot:Cvel_29590.t1-p1 / transcript=Cvel_29590.t1 / gene=Cvel_29590 / organism=Chromera_velia_CCMP2878 / gene_product=hypothetical protein / transcript_product=hypothetical protein / location=Cvel_scaffold4076:7009-8100(-) / protein_length=364 / sequence_SO=supercontig / SO=protein_coding / is_pseudo=false
MTSDRRKEGGINEMGRPGMIKLKEGCDAIVQDLLLPYVDIPMEGVFSSLSKEAQMVGVGGLKYPEYNRKMSLKVRHIVQDYLTGVRATDQTFVAAGGDHACTAEVCVLLTELAWEVGIKEVRNILTGALAGRGRGEGGERGRVKNLSVQPMTRGMGGMGVGGGNGSMTSDLRSGGIMMKRIEVSREEEGEIDALMGAASAGATPMPAVAAAGGRGGGTGRNGTGRPRSRPRGGGRGEMSLSVPGGRDRLVMGAGVQSMDTGAQTRESSTKRDRVRSASSEEHDGGANSGFDTPRSGEEEAERRTPKRAVTLFRLASAGRGRKVLSAYRIHSLSVPMDGGRINYADLVDLPVYRQPRNDGLGGQR